ncbi:hypothetical protein, partial [Undibacterium sp.]|uniref:hypothetical protein n=1 Tax=Undibacterium sp. TaxID=1914977 RepID=UPI00374DB3E6
MQSTKSRICGGKVSWITRRLLIAWITIVMVGGCASTGNALTDYKGADAGYVVLSLGQSDNKVTMSPILSGYRLETSDELEFQYSSDPKGVVPLDDWQSGTGMAVAKKLPPGEYEINHAHFSIGSSEFRFSVLLAKPIRFSIKPGETSYIGSYLMSLTSK